MRAQAVGALAPARRAPAARAWLERGAWAWSALLTCGYLLVLLLALAPRLHEVAVPMTGDEPLWMERAIRFARAVEQGDARGTFQTGHPGVGTMWVAALGGGLGRVAGLDDAEFSLLDPAGAAAWAGARAAMAITTSVLLALVAALAGRLLGHGVGLTAGALLAGEPWLVAHGRILHLDGLVSLLSAICLLAALIFWQRGGGWPLLVLCGAAAGLATLTRISAATMGPVLVLFAARAASGLPSARRWRVLGHLAVIGGCALAVALAAWPALRGDPLWTLSHLWEFASEKTGEEQLLGQYFLGETVAIPGPLFYPVVLLLRLSPLVLAGLVLCVVPSSEFRVPRGRGANEGKGGPHPDPLAPREGDAAVSVSTPPAVLPTPAGRVSAPRGHVTPRFVRLGGARGAEQRSGHPSGPPELGTRNSELVWMLVGAAVVMLLVFSLVAKQRSQYAAVATPLLEIVAAAGFVRAGRRWLPGPAGGRPSGVSLPLLAGALGAAQLALCATVMPYYFSFYDPLLGGLAGAQRVILVGWGEELGPVADYLNHQPQTPERRLAAAIPRSVFDAMAPQLAIRMLPTKDVNRAHYLLTYVNAVQRGQEVPAGAALVLTVRLHGVEMARLYCVKPDAGEAAPGCRSRLGA